MLFLLGKSGFRVFCVSLAGIFGCKLDEIFHNYVSWLNLQTLLFLTLSGAVEVS